MITDTSVYMMLLVIYCMNQLSPTYKWQLWLGGPLHRFISWASCAPPRLGSPSDTHIIVILGFNCRSMFHKGLPLKTTWKRQLVKNTIVQAVGVCLGMLAWHLCFMSCTGCQYVFECYSRCWLSPVKLCMAWENWHYVKDPPISNGICLIGKSH